jgi:GntR family transcriptional regulator
MATDITSPIPLYHQISVLLESRIQDGEYPVGTVIPSEDELQIEFGVSRATVRQAVGELVRRGMVMRRRGSGTWVLPDASRLASSRFRGSLANLMSERSARMKTVEITRGLKPLGRVADLLQVGAGTVTRITREWEFEQLPIAYKLNYVLEPYAEKVTKQVLAREPHLMRLIESRGARIVRAEQSIRARVADKTVSDHLNIAIGAPVLFVERLVFEEFEGPVELAQTWYQGDTYEYSIDFDLSGDQGAEANLA